MKLQAWITCSGNKASSAIYCESCKKPIDYYQKMVINARNQMNFQQEKLLQKNIEVKKYEKMKEKGLLQIFRTVETWMKQNKWMISLFNISCIEEFRC